MNPGYWLQMDRWGKREGWRIASYRCSTRRLVAVGFVTTRPTFLAPDGLQLGMVLN